MFSKRFYNLCAKVTNIGRKYGATLLYFDEKEQLFHNSEDPKILRLFNWNYNLLMFWVLASFSLIPKHYIDKNIKQYNLILFHWIMELAPVLTFSILRWYSLDYCRWINGILIVFRHFHRTFI